MAALEGPTLVHLNGASGVGKSTLARVFADEHPGCLDLDIDQVISMLGGWRRNFVGLLEPTRSLAIAMAEHHLAAGHLVVMPQLVMRLDQAQRFEAAAGRAGARYVEIGLSASPEVQRRRFLDKSERTEVDAHIGSGLRQDGLDAALPRIQDQFARYAEQRPELLRLDTTDQSVQQSHRELEQLLDR